jgi:hypothetical protein
VELKKINATLLILSGLLFLSFGFFVSAQNASSGTSNIMLDSDQDGLTDQEEKLYGTDPHNPDTDGDGYMDGAEVKAGYNPLKPAPGDKIGTETGTSTNTAANTVQTANTDQNNSANNQTSNLTQQVSQKISSLAQESDPSKQQVSVDDINQLVTDTLSGKNQPPELPIVNKSDIQIKEQNYDKYGTDKAAAMKKDDFENYIAQVFYIFASNSPKPLTSATDMTTVISETVQQITTALMTRDASTFDNITLSGQKILDQLKDVQVPEELVDMHIKAMQYALYAQNLKDYVKPNPDDPLADIVNFSQISSFVESLIGFSTDVESKLAAYNLNYGDIQTKIESYGVPAPDLSGATSTDTTGSSTTTDTADSPATNTSSTSN